MSGSYGHNLANTFSGVGVPQNSRLDLAELQNYEALKRAVLASEARKKEELRRKRIEMGLPPDEKKGFWGRVRGRFKSEAGTGGRGDVFVYRDEFEAKRREMGEGEGEGKRGDGVIGGRDGVVR